MLDVRRLAALVVVARTGSLTAASQEFGVTQPAISQQLRALESQCGVALVVRAGRGVRLTAAGMMLASRAVPILAALASAEDELAALQRGEIGRVRVLAARGAFEPLVAPALAAARSAHPGLEISLGEMSWQTHRHSIDEVLRGDADVAVAIEGMFGLDSPDLVTEVVATTGLAVAVPADHPLAAEHAVAGSRLSEFDLVVVSDVVPAIAGSDFLEVHADPRRVTVLSDTSAVLALVTAGLGVGVIAFPELVEVPAGVVIVPVTTTRDLTYVSVVRRHFEPSTAVLAALAALRDVAAQRDHDPDHDE